MIVLDTHMWIWWVQGDPQLLPVWRSHILQNQNMGLGVSAISCLEVARLVEGGRIVLPRPVGDWIDAALAYPGVGLLDLTPRIAVESTQLPGDFHRDPADRIIVATARLHGCALLTADRKILDYPHVTTLK